jgi:hypothetical protein
MTSSGRLRGGGLLQLLHNSTLFDHLIFEVTLTRYRSLPSYTTDALQASRDASDRPAGLPLCIRACPGTEKTYGFEQLPPVSCANDVGKAHA